MIQYNIYFQTHIRIDFRYIAIWRKGRGPGIRSNFYPLTDSRLVSDSLSLSLELESIRDCVRRLPIAARFPGLQLRIKFNQIKYEKM